MKLSPKDIENVAKLARLGLSPEEKAKYQGELSAILDYVEQLNEVDTAGIEPIENIAGLSSALRPDDAHRAPERSDLLAAAPALEHDQVKVREVFGE